MTQNKKEITVGIFGGSFNPVHNGHIALAKELVRCGVVDEVWLTLSPLNPIKENRLELIDDKQRLEMLQLATEGIPGLRVCDIELSMPRPSFTINTLRTLDRMHPAIHFRLIIGADNMLIFDRWKAHEEIARDYTPIVYPRPGYEYSGSLQLPVHDISSSQIRELVANGLDINHLVPHTVAHYIAAHALYKK